MGNYYAPETVLKGIAYLDDRYPDWLSNVDPDMLDMYDVRQHILAQVWGILVYETKEIVFWSRRELGMHGFLPPAGMNWFPSLTREWAFNVRRLREERM